MDADDYNLKWNNFETGITRKGNYYIFLVTNLHTFCGHPTKSWPTFSLQKVVFEGLPDLELKLTIALVRLSKAYIISCQSGLVDIFKKKELFDVTLVCGDNKLQVLLKTNCIKNKEV